MTFWEFLDRRASRPGRITLRDVIGVALISGFLLAIFVLFGRPIPQSNEQLIVYMLGQLSGFVAGVVSYHYVLSKQSETATENTGRAFDAIAATAQAGAAASTTTEQMNVKADAVTVEGGDAHKA